MESWGLFPLPLNHPGYCASSDGSGAGEASCVTPEPGPQEICSPAVVARHVVPGSQPSYTKADYPKTTAL